MESQRLLVEKGLLRLTVGHCIFMKVLAQRVLLILIFLCINDAFKLVLQLVAAIANLLL